MTNDFFRSIENPNEVRRKVLGSSKSIIQNLKGYGKILEIREKKSLAIRSLKAEIKEINLFNLLLRHGFSRSIIWDVLLKTLGPMG